MKDLVSITLAGGKGTRMKSELPKVLHEINGKPMVSYVIDTLEKMGIQRRIVVVGYKANLVKEALKGRAEFVLQEEQLGTGHAVMVCEDALNDYNGYVLISYGDMPFISEEIIKKMYRVCKDNDVDMSMLVAIIKKDKPEWGRIVRNEKDEVVDIVEVKDANKEELAINELNTGVYCVKKDALFNVLKQVGNKNASGEYYLTDIVKFLAGEGEKIETVQTEDLDMIIGINRPEELKRAREIQ